MGSSGNRGLVYWEQKACVPFNVNGKREHITFNSCYMLRGVLRNNMQMISPSSTAKPSYLDNTKPHTHLVHFNQEMVYHKDRQKGKMQRNANNGSTSSRWQRKIPQQLRFQTGWMYNRCLTLPFNYSTQNSTWQEAGVRKSNAPIVWFFFFHKCLKVPQWACRSHTLYRDDL